MATEWKSQQGEGKFALQFETDDVQKYKLVEKAAQMAMDGKTEADFVEVVYCRNCEYNENGVCIHPDNITHSYDSDDNVYDYYISVWSGHFCSYGERVTDTNVGGK